MDQSRVQSLVGAEVLPCTVPEAEGAFEVAPTGDPDGAGGVLSQAGDDAKLPPLDLANTCLTPPGVPGNTVGGSQPERSVPVQEDAADAVTGIREGSADGGPSAKGVPVEMEPPGRGDPEITLSGDVDEVNAAVAAGELWRLFTAHLTHFTLDHLVLDVLAFLVLGIACERRSPRRTRWTLGLSALVISVGVLLIDPQMQRYRGLSGLDSALFALLFASMLRDSMLRDRERKGKARLLLWIPGILFLAKIGYEAVSGTAVFLDSSAAGFTPAPEKPR